MILPEDQKTKDLFITLFKAAMKEKKFSAVELLQTTRCDHIHDLVLARALSLLREYCVVFPGQRWEVRPTVLHKFRNGYYNQFGIVCE